MSAIGPKSSIGPRSNSMRGYQPIDNRQADSASTPRGTIHHENQSAITCRDLVRFSHNLILRPKRGPIYFGGRSTDHRFGSVSLLLSARDDGLNAQAVDKFRSQNSGDRRSSQHVRQYPSLPV